jgi:Family of unknown function (DUF5689)
MKNNFKYRSLIFVLFTFFSACVNDTFDVPIQDDCVNPALTKTKEVSEIYALASSLTAIYTADDIVEGYIISSEEGGNFFKNMYIQPLDGSKGFSLSVDEGNTYTKYFQPGKKVFLKLKGLAFALPSSNAKGLIFGAAPTEDFAVDRLPSSTFREFLIPSCELVNEEEIVHKISLSQATNDTYLNTLIEIDDVQFKTDCATYSKVNFDTSLKITNGEGTLDVRTSRYANFAGYTVPPGRGKIRGVLTKFGLTYQLILRTERDVQFNNPRVQPIVLPKGGTNLQYFGAFTENFESYATTTTGANLPKYINDATIGTKFWDVATFSSNEYLQMSAFNSGCSKAYFTIPVDFTVAKEFLFKSKDGYNDGNPLRVYYSTNYIPGSSIEQATLIEITNKFRISTGNTDGYGSEFINSGVYSIPIAVTGNGFFIFEYDGTSGITTTIQLDDIVVR